MKKYKITSSDGICRVVEGNIIEDSIGQDFFGTKAGTEEADDILFAIQAYFGHPEWTYEVARKKCSEKDMQQAIAYVKRKGYNKFNYFDSIKDTSDDVIRKLIADEDEAIREYEKAISQFKDKPHFVGMFEDIRDDEMTHRRLLNQMLKHINDSHKWELGQRVRYEGAWYYVINFLKGQWVLVPEDGNRANAIYVEDSIKDAGTKLWQVHKGFAVVAESYWHQYKSSSYVDRVCATLDEAEYVRDSLERNDGMSFCIINCEKGYVRVS